MENSSPVTAYDPGYSPYFGFELRYNPEDGKRWFVEKWHYCFYYMTTYVVLVFAGQSYMKKREPFGLRPLLVIWNIALSAFSILATIRVIPELYYVLGNFGFVYSICNSNHQDFPVTSFWNYIYLHSKVPELGDTAFVILRKQKLIFLHWFHHAMTIFISWFIASRPLGVVRWYTVMNLTVHSAMYTYFALRALNVKVPKPIAMLITFSQISQMFIGFAFSLYAYYVYKSSGECDVTESAVTVALLAYISYLGLFLKFFYGTYMCRTSAHLKEK